MSNVHKFMTSLPSDGGCHMDVCVCGWAVCCCSASLLFLLLLLRVSSVYIVSLKIRPEERKLPPYRGNGQMLKLIIII